MALSTTQTDSQRRRAALLGISAGLRSQIPLAYLVHAANRGDLSLGQSDLDRWLRDPRVVRLITLSAVGELVVDKLPFVPPRTDPASLAGRLLFGAIAGAAGARSLGGSVASGGALGAIASGVSAIAGTTYRRGLPHITGLPDIVLALAEDAAAQLLAHKALTARNDNLT